MDKLNIYGGRQLSGEVWVSGAKNAALPIIVSALLCDDPMLIGNVPHLHDVTTTMELLGRMGAAITIDEKMNIEVDTRHLHSYRAPYRTRLGCCA